MGDLGRFVLAEDLAIEQPWPTGRKQHYDKGCPVAVDTGSALFERIKGSLRAEDSRDQRDRAAVLLRQG